jgi:CHAT domain-containing protein
LEGLAQAFLYAGTPAVMSSSWNVEDDSTAFLMARFYTHPRQGTGRAESLRLAQMETRKRFPTFTSGRRSCSQVTGAEPGSRSTNSSSSVS